MRLDIEYLAVLGFCVETLTEAVKKWLKLDSDYTLIFAVLFGLLLAILTTPQGIKYQLEWSSDIPDWVSNIITGIVLSSCAKFFDYLFKWTKLKEN